MLTPSIIVAANDARECDRWPDRPADSRAGLRPLRGAAALGLIEHDLAQPHCGRGRLDTLVVGDVLECLLPRHRPRRNQLLEALRSRRSDVGELLLLRRVDVHIVGAGVLADDHPLVDLDAWTDEELAALLQGEQRVAGARTPAVGD